MVVHDILVFGATGFTGRLVARYLLSPSTSGRAGRPLSIALAGRSHERLEALRASLPGKPSLILADSLNDDVATLEGVVKRARVVVCTAGPFLQVAEPVVKACARLGVHYVDITGETPFVKRCIDRYDALARSNACYIVNMAGFDSVPSDLGTLRMVRRMRELFLQPTRSVRCFATMRGQLSGGTLASGMAMERDPELLAQMQDPFLLGGGRKPGLPRSEDRDVARAEPFAAAAESPTAWTAPFMMAELNTRTVRRSNALFEEHGAPYGDDFGYSERMLVWDESTAAKLARPSPPVAKREEMVRAGRLPKQGEGPSEAERAKSWFKFVFEGTAEDGRILVSSVAGGDPGYDETSKMCAESALGLLLDSEHMNAKHLGVHGGCVTPAFAFGDVLVRRLEAAGIVFQDEPVTSADGPSQVLKAAALPSPASKHRSNEAQQPPRSKM